MAIRWDWKEKCGEATFLDRLHKAGEEDKEFTVSLYTGNCTLIMLYEWKDKDGETLWNMFSFWADKNHMKNCLGLNKKEGYTDNDYNSGYYKMTKIRLDKAKCRYINDIVPALTKAFDDLTIEIYNSDKKED